MRVALYRDWRLAAGCGRRQSPDLARRQLDGRAPPRDVRRRRAAGRVRQGTRGLPLWANHGVMQGGGGSTEFGGACLGRAGNPACRHVEQHQPGQSAFDHASGHGRRLCRMVADRHLPALRCAADGPARNLATGPDHHPGVDADVLPGLPRPCRSHDLGQQPAGMARPGGAGVGTGELRLRQAGRHHATGCQGASERFGQAGLLEHGIRGVPADDALRNRELRLRDRGPPKFMAALGRPDKGAAGIP